MKSILLVHLVFTFLGNNFLSLYLDTWLCILVSNWRISLSYQQETLFVDRKSLSDIFLFLYRSITNVSFKPPVQLELLTAFCIMQLFRQHTAPFSCLSNGLWSTVLDTYHHVEANSECFLKVYVHGVHFNHYQGMFLISDPKHV